jgi:uncharacterized membrane protein HdeD (DUF308 family)
MSHASQAAAAGTLEVLTLNWWSLIVRGSAAIVFGAAVLLAPELTLDALAALFAAYAILDGAVNLIAGFQERARGERWGALFLQGITGLAAGVLTLLWSDRTVLTLLVLIGTWAVAVGLLQIASVLRVGRFRRGELLLALAGAVSALFGVVIVASPVAGVSVLGISIALYALGSGGLLIALGRRFRNRARRGVVVAQEAARRADAPSSAPELPTARPTPAGR